MIVERLLDWFFGSIVWVFEHSLTLGMAPPSWVTDAWSGLDSLLVWLHQLDHWIPVNLALNVGLAVLTAYFVGLLIGAVRVVLSYVTFGGNT